MMPNSLSKNKSISGGKIIIVAKNKMRPIDYQNLTFEEKQLSHKLWFDDRPVCSFTQEAFLYHATSIKHLESIKTYGLRTRQDLGLSKEDPSKHAFISAARTRSGVGTMLSGLVVLRFKPTGIWKAQGGSDEVRTMQPVHPGTIEKETSRGWEPI